MSTSTGATQRKKPSISSSTIEVPTLAAPYNNENLNASSPLSASNPSAVVAPTKVAATVRRRRFGTSPFDENWLNLDCCGLFCACMTYLLHMYAVYVVNFILLPPWMSYYSHAGTSTAILQPMTRTTEGIAHDTTTTTTTATTTAANDLLVRHLTWGGWFHSFLFFSIALLAVMSHFKAMTTDPGAVPPDAKPIPEPPTTTEADDANDLLEQPANDNDAVNRSLSSRHNSKKEPNPLLKNPPKPKGLRLCRRCNSFKPPRAHHCSICKRCIIKMDHHCPWVNNCVGIGNHKYFLLFVFYTFLSCMYSLTLVVFRFWECINIHSRSPSHRLRGTHSSSFSEGHYHHSSPILGGDDPSCLDKPSHLLTLLGLLVEGLLFGMFTSCMIIDQMDVVRSKMTHIDRIKSHRRNSNTSTHPSEERMLQVTGYQEVFGMQYYDWNTDKTSSKTTKNSYSHRGYLYNRIRSATTTTTSTTSTATTTTTTTTHPSINNHHFQLHWLSPLVKVSFPPSIKNEIFGFCRPIASNNHPGRDCCFSSTTINNNNNNNNNNTPSLNATHPSAATVTSSSTNASMDTMTMTTSATTTTTTSTAANIV